MRWDQASKRSMLPQVRELPPRRDEGVLQSVLGEIRVAQDPLSHRVQPIADLMHQDSERVAVAPTGLIDEVSIHRRLGMVPRVGRAVHTL